MNFLFLPQKKLWKSNETKNNPQNLQKFSKYDSILLSYFCFMDASNYILLSELNDFIFCPRLIYWHHIYGNYNKNLYQSTYQTEGTQVHSAVDNRKYSSKKEILQ